MTKIELLAIVCVWLAYIIASIAGIPAIIACCGAVVTSVAIVSSQTVLKTSLIAIVWAAFAAIFYFDDSGSSTLALVGAIVITAAIVNTHKL